MTNKVGDFLDAYQLHIDMQSRYIDFMSEAGRLGKTILDATDYGLHSAEPTDAFRKQAGETLFALEALLSESGINPEEILEEILADYRSRMEEYPG